MPGQLANVNTQTRGMPAGWVFHRAIKSVVGGGEGLLEESCLFVESIKSFLLLIHLYINSGNKHMCTCHFHFVDAVGCCSWEFL